MSKETKLGLLISGGGSNMEAIVESCRTGILRGLANVAFVATDRPETSKGYQWAKNEGFDYFAVDYNGLKQRTLDQQNLNQSGNICHKEILDKQTDFLLHKTNWQKGLNGFKKVHDYLNWKVFCERMMLSHMRLFDFDLLVLAGYMQFCTSYFIDEVQKQLGSWRIMNIHPAILPSFPGAHGYKDAWNYGVMKHGATVHFLDYGEDDGPIIGQSSYERLGSDTFKSFCNRGLQLEHELYPQCIRLFAENRIRFRKSATGRDVVDILSNLNP